MHEKISVSIDEDVLRELHSHLEYGDSRSEFIQEAVEEKLERDFGEGNAQGMTLETVD